MVVNFDRHLVRVTREAQAHRRAPRTVLHGVRYQIGNRLQNALFVPGAAAIDVALEGDRTIAREWFDLFDDLLAHGTQIE